MNSQSNQSLEVNEADADSSGAHARHRTDTIC